MRHVLVPMILLCVPIATAAEDLLDVHQLALQNDPQFRAARHNLEAVRETRPIAQAALFPELSADAAYGVQRNEITGDDPQGTETTRTDTSKPHDYGLTLRQVIFDGEAFARLRQAGDEIAVGEAEFRGARQSLGLRVAGAYFDVLAAKDDLRLARAENEAVKRQLDQAEGRFRAGISAITAVQEAKAQHDLTRATIVEAERQLRTRLQALAEITGRTPSSTAVLQDEIPLASPAPDDADAWVEGALEQNPEVLAARSRERVAEHEVEIRRSDHWPTLFVEGSQTFGRSAGFNQGDFDTRQVFLSVSLPLFRGLETVASVRQSRSLVERRRAEVDEARRAAERRTRDAFLGVTSGVARVQALRQAVKSNRTALEASEAGLQVGTRTIVDVLNAQRLLFQAERDLSRARYEYLLSVLRLKRAAGRLDRTDLAGINDLLTQKP